MTSTITTEAAPNVEPTPKFHRIEVTLTGGIHTQVTFKGVCDAPPGADCRMWCEFDLCSEGYQEGHEDHALFDQGECSVISCLNGDPSLIPELYDGPEAPLLPGFIDLTWDNDGVVWSYADLVYAYSPIDEMILADRWFHQSGDSWMAVTPTESAEDWFTDQFEPWMIRDIHDVPTDRRVWRDHHGSERDTPAQPLSHSERGELNEYRRREAAGYIEYALKVEGAADGDPKNHKGLTKSAAISLRNFAKGRGFPAAEVVERTHPAPGSWVSTTGPSCEPDCRHECGECRLGLGTHRTCDQRCDHHLPPAARQ